MIRERLIDAIADLRRYTPAEDWTPEQIAQAILVAIPEIASIDGLKCRECGGNLTELDVATQDGLCALCRDVAQVVA